MACARGLGSGGAAALLLTLPWWLRLLQSPAARGLAAAAPVDAAWRAVSTLDWNLIWAPRGALSLAAATAGLSSLLPGSPGGQWLPRLGLFLVAGAVGLAAWSWRRPRLRRLTQETWLRWLLVWTWVAVLAILLQLDRLGLPPLRISHVNAGAMTLFVPIALAGSGLLAWALGLLAPPRLAPYLAGTVVLVLGVWGARGMTNIVNPATILATGADRAALAWIRGGDSGQRTLCRQHLGLDTGHLCRQRRRLLDPSTGRPRLDSATPHLQHNHAAGRSGCSQ